jgi:hypothetical protein
MNIKNSFLHYISNISISTQVISVIVHHHITQTLS